MSMLPRTFHNTLISPTLWPSHQALTRLYDHLFQGSLLNNTVTAQHNTNLMTNNTLNLPSQSTTQLVDIQQFYAIWQHRGPKLPISLETTFLLLQILNGNHPETFQSREHFDNTHNPLTSTPQTLLRYTLSMILLRFVNGLVDSMQQSSKTAISVLRLATTIDLPRLLVDIRHSATHNDLPSLELLYNGSIHALFWLHNRYWKPMIIPSNILTKNISFILQQLRKNMISLSKIYKQYKVTHKETFSPNDRDIEESEEFSHKITIFNMNLPQNSYCNGYHYNLSIQHRDFWEIPIQNTNNDYLRTFFHEISSQIIQNTSQTDKSSAILRQLPETPLEYASSIYNIVKFNGHQTINATYQWSTPHFGQYFYNPQYLFQFYDTLSRFNSILLSTHFLSNNFIRSQALLNNNTARQFITLDEDYLQPYQFVVDTLLGGSMVQNEQKIERTCNNTYMLYIIQYLMQFFISMYHYNATNDADNLKQNSRIDGGNNNKKKQASQKNTKTQPQPPPQHSNKQHKFHYPILTRADAIYAALLPALAHSSSTSQTLNLSTLMSHITHDTPSRFYSTLTSPLLSATQPIVYIIHYKMIYQHYTTFMSKHYPVLSSHGKKSKNKYKRMKNADDVSLNSTFSRHMLPPNIHEGGSSLLPSLSLSIPPSNMVGDGEESQLSQTNCAAQSIFNQFLSNTEAMETIDALLAEMGMNYDQTTSSTALNAQNSSNNIFIADHKNTNPMKRPLSLPSLIQDIPSPFPQNIPSTNDTFEKNAKKAKPNIPSKKSQKSPNIIDDGNPFSMLSSLYYDPDDSDESDLNNIVFPHSSNRTKNEQKKASVKKLSQYEEFITAIINVANQNTGNQGNNDCLRPDQFFSTLYYFYYVTTLSVTYIINHNIDIINTVLRNSTTNTILHHPGQIHVHQNNQTIIYPTLCNHYTLPPLHSLFNDFSEQSTLQHENLSNTLEKSQKTITETNFVSFVDFHNISTLFSIAQTTAAHPPPNQTKVQARENVELINTIYEFLELISSIHTTTAVNLPGSISSPLDLFTFLEDDDENDGINDDKMNQDDIKNKNNPTPPSSTSNTHKITTQDTLLASPQIPYFTIQPLISSLLPSLLLVPTTKHSAGVIAWPTDVNAIPPSSNAVEKVFSQLHMTWSPLLNTIFVTYPGLQQQFLLQILSLLYRIDCYFIKNIPLSSENNQIIDRDEQINVINDKIDFILKLTYSTAPIDTILKQTSYNNITSIPTGQQQQLLFETTFDAHTRWIIDILVEWFIAFLIPLIPEQLNPENLPSVYLDSDIDKPTKENQPFHEIILAKHSQYKSQLDLYCIDWAYIIEYLELLIISTNYALTSNNLPATIHTIGRLFHKLPQLDDIRRSYREKNKDNSVNKIKEMSYRNPSRPCQLLL